MRLSSHHRMLLLLVTLALGACSQEEEPGPSSPPPPAVEVLTLEAQPVPHVIELPGRVHAVRIAEIRSRVDGIIQRRLYEEGTDVEAGQQLFQIDPREMQASLSAAKAALERAEATAANAAQDVKRYQGLVAKRAISQQEYDAAQARLRTARADVAQAKAELETARLNLEYTSVESPIDGLAGRAQVTEGALVSGADGTLLTRVEQSDPVYVNFSQSSSDLLALRARVAAGDLQLPEKGEVAVNLILENGSEYPHTGYLDFLAMTIDVETGTVALRAEFPNPDRLLLPGQFVQARIHAGTQPDGLRIPQRAVIMTDSGPSVMLVGEDDMAVTREIKVGAMQGSDWVVREGLAPGDRVIVEGWQKARSGAPVRPVPFEGAEAEPDQTPAGAAAQ